MMNNLLLVSICLTLILSSAVAKNGAHKKDEESSKSSSSTSKSFDKPLVTRKPLNLRCEHSFLDTLLALRQTIEHYAIDLVAEIGWDFDLHESLHTQLRPTRTLIINAEAIEDIIEADPTALSFFPLRVGVYLDAEGETRLVFQDSNHFISAFDVYEASAALEQLDRILWKLAESAHCKLHHHGVESTDGSTTYALIRTEQVEQLEALELREEGLPGLAVSCGHCIDVVTYGDNTTNDLEEGFGYLQESFLEDFKVPLEVNVLYKPEGDILSDESRFVIVSLDNDYLNYYLLKSAGQEASGFLPVTVGVYYEDLTSEDPVAATRDLCVTTLGTDYFEAAFHCPLPDVICEAQEAFFTLPKPDTVDAPCPDTELPLFDTRF